MVRKLKKHGPGSNNNSCGKKCRKSCCEETPPDALQVLIGNSTCGCGILTLNYTKADNPDGHPGMWSGGGSLDCGAGCDTETVSLKIWCNHPCDSCLCDCNDWSLQIDGGDIHRIDEDNHTSPCCCGGVGGRNYAWWQSTLVTAGPCNGEGLFVLATWDSENTCLDTVQTTCCLVSISRELTVTIEGPNNHTSEFLITNTGFDCGADCKSAWTGTGTTICRDSGGTEYAAAVEFTLCCNEDTPLPGADPSDWLGTLKVCNTEIDEGMDTVTCPTCDGSPFYAQGNWTFPGTICTHCDASDNNYLITVTDKCNQISNCANTPYNSVEVVLHEPGNTDCECGRGFLTYEAVSNPCGCVGQWRGNITLHCKDGGACDEDTVEVIICTDCEECDIADCLCSNWKVTLNDGTATEGDDCCCAQTGGDKAWIYFGDTVVGGSGTACSGKTLSVKAWWRSGHGLPTATSACAAPLDDVLYFDYTDTCGNTSTVQLTGGLTCDDANYFASWSRTFNAGSWDGTTCTTTSHTITVRYKRDYTWECVLEGCFSQSPKTVVPTVTCDSCDGVSTFELSGTFAGPFTGCDDDEYDTTNNFTFTVTEI